MTALTQFYQIDKIVTDKWTVVFDEIEAACQMVVLSEHTAMMCMTNPSRALDGSLTWAWPEAHIQSIEYTLYGSPDGQRIGMQRYQHKFTTDVVISRGGTMMAKQGALFIPYQLDVILDSKAFGKAQGIQFIA
jgi:hypothetical protein